MTCLPLLVLGLFLSAPPPDQVQRLAADILSEESIQSRFPTGGDASGPAGPRLRRTEPAPSREREVSGGGSGSLTLQTLLWALVVAGCALAAFYLAQRLGGYAADLEVAGSTPGSGAPSARAPPPLAAADDLASQGRYEEAIHTLLLLALHPLTEERSLAGSLTSREVLRRVELPAAAQEAMGALVRAVELAVFGGRPPGRSDYEACAAHYRTYAATMGAEAA